jgi:uncharacterized phiE125 gp8 family phage protein
MGLVRIVPPTSEPLTTLEAIRHLRLDETNVEPRADAPTVALAVATPGNVDNGVHRYCVTFVTADGETDGGAISDVVTVVNKTIAGQVNVSNIPIGGSAVVARRLYRTKAAADDFFLLATLPNNTTRSIIDNTADAALGAGIPIANTTGDSYVRSLVIAAREFVEVYQSRALITQQWRMDLDGFPPRYVAAYQQGSELALVSCVDLERGLIRLPKPPLISVDSVTYVDPDGATQTLDPSLYVVNTSELRGEITLAYGASWPSTRSQRHAVSVLFTCGYGSAAAVPETTKQAMKLLIGQWNENREATIDAKFAQEVPFAVSSLLWLNRVVEAA